MTETRQACSEQIYHVSRSELPLSCPLPDMSAWNAHPRVYLPIEDKGEVVCPYCGALFVLTGE